MNKAALRSIIESTIVKSFIFFFSTAAAFIASKLVDNIVKPGTDYGIVNYYTNDGFNPNQTFVKIAVIVAGSAVIYWGLTYLFSNYRKAFTFAAIALATFVVFGVTLTPDINDNVGNVDTFHHGEQLSPGNALTEGKRPFTDMYVLHGAGEDIIIPSLALQAASPQHGISMYYFITMLLMTASAAAFFFMLSLLFKNIAIFLVTSFWFAFGVYSTIFYVRDIFVWASISIICYLLLGKPGKMARIISFASLGALASGSMLYSIDRGFIVCSMVLVFAIFSIFLRQKGTYSIFTKPSSVNSLIPFILISVSGVFVQLLFLALIGWQQYKNFLSISLIDIPKYQGMLFTYPLQDISFATLLIWIPIILIAPLLFMIYRVIGKDWKESKRLDTRVILIMVLLVGCALFIRSGYGRSDFGHIAYSTPILFVTIFYTMTVYVSKFRSKADFGKLILPAAIIGLLLFPTLTIDLNKVTAFMNITPRVVIDFLLLPSRHDNVWLPNTVSNVSEYLKQNTNNETDGLFVFTQQPIYYYLTDLENPTRYYIPWFADPTPLEKDMLLSLQKEPPKFILYSSSTGWDEIDGVGMDKRTPSVNSWIKKNYTNSVVIDGVTLLYQ